LAHADLAVPEVPSAVGLNHHGDRTRWARQATLPELVQPADDCERGASYRC